MSKTNKTQKISITDKKKEASFLCIFEWNCLSWSVPSTACLLIGRKGEVMDFAFKSTDTLCSFIFLINAYNEAEKEWQGKAYH